MSTHAPSPEQVRAALGELLSWSELIRSPQLSKFLKHIVDAKLAGDEASIKAYSIAVDVFGRPPSFDPQSDPIVRVQARRLRGLLQEFYRQNLGKTGTRITLPVGRYVPEFDFLEISETESASSAPAQTLATVTPDAATSAPPLAAEPRFGRRFWAQAAAGLAVVLALGLLLFGINFWRTPQVLSSTPIPPDEPTVYVSAFSNLSKVPSLDRFVVQLSNELSTYLAQFEDVTVKFVEPGQPVKADGTGFQLTGTVAAAGSGIEVRVLLSETDNGSIVWTRTLRQSTPGIEDTTVAANTARQVMRELGSFRSPIHAEGRRWLDENTKLIPAVNPYICLLTYRYAREATSPSAIAKSLDCNERLIAQKPDEPLALAALSWLESRAIYSRVQPGDALEAALAEPVRLAERAITLAPESSFAHEQFAAVQNLEENFGRAQRHYAIALGFQQLNTDARAGYAVALSRSGDWDQAERQAQFSIADTAYPAPWYYYIPALVALRNGDYAAAIENGRLASQAGEVGVLVALAAAGLAHDEQAILELQPRAMNLESLRRIGIIPWLSIRIKDQTVLHRVSEGLAAAGIPESALTSQF